jgi:hypothetical protein
MLFKHSMGPLREAAGDGTGGGGGGAGNPGTPNGGGNPGQQIDVSQFVSKKDFDGVAAQLRRVEKGISDSVTTALETLGIVKKGDDGKYVLAFQTAASGGNPSPANGGTGNGNGDGQETPEMKRIKALEKQLSDERAAREQEKKLRLDASRDASLISALSKANAINPRRDFIHLLNGVVVKEDGSVIAKKKDEFGGDVEITLDEYVETFLKANPELKKAATSGGSGTPAGSAGGANGGTVIPYEKWSDPKFYQANLAKFDSGEYVRGPRPGR